MRKHLHPLLQTVSMVTRNGSSSSFFSVLKQGDAPLFVTVDKLLHPAWTGQREGVSLEDERMQKLLSKYETWGDALKTDKPAEKSA